MAEEKRKVQLEVGVAADTSGLDQIAQAAQEMAQGVQQAGAQAKLGLDAISNAAEPAAQKIDQATSRMAASIQRATAALQTGAKGSADYYQSLAAARGIDVAPLEAYIAELRRVEAAQKSLQQANAQAARADSFIASIKAQAEAAGKSRSELLALQAAQLGLSQQAAPYVQRLKETEQALLAGAHGAGEFGFQTAAAKRELLVLTHELATGNVKNFGTSMLVLGERTGAASLLFSSTALTAAALVGAVVAVGVAAAKGASELKAFQEATTLTGNAIGLSASGFTQLRDSLVGIAGTRGKAAEALTEIAQNGKIAGTSVQGIAEAAILMERATGQAISKTVEQFAELAKSPAEASAKLNTQYHYLTAAVYEQIKALEDQGKATQAAKLAEDTYAAALKDRAETVIGSAGTMQRAWTSVTDVARKAWDAMLGIGRAQSPAEAVAAAAAKVAQLQAQIAAGPGPDRGASLGMSVPGLGVAAAGGGQRAASQRLAAAQQELADAQKRLEIEDRNTVAKAEQNRLEQLGIAFHQDDDKFLTKKQKEQKELTKAETEGQELVNAGIITEEQLRTRLNGIRQKYIETTGQNEVAQIRAQTLAQQQYLASLQKQFASGDYTEPVKLTEGAKKVLEINAELRGSLSDVARGEKERALAAAKSLEAVDDQVAAQEKLNKVDQESKALLKAQVDAASHEADAIRARADAQDAANSTFGKSKTAIEEMRLAQLMLSAAQMDATEKAIPANVAALQAQVKEQERLVAGLQKAEALHLQQQLGEGTRNSQEEAATLQLELSLVGQTQEVRTRILAQRKAELDLAKELARIDQSGATDAQKDDLRAKARQKALIDSSNAAVKANVDQWQRASDEINDSLTDALLRAFESGQGFAANLRDAVKKIFADMVLKPVIQSVLSPISSSIAAGGRALGGIGNLAGIGGSVLGGFSLGNAGGTLFANATGTGLDGLLAATGAYGTAAGAGAAAAGGTGLLGAASAGLAAIGPVGWAGLAALAAYTIFGGKGGGPKTESGAGIGVRTTGDVAGVATQIQGIQQQYSDLATALGGRGGQLDLGIFSSQDPKGTAQTQLAVNAYLNGQSIYNRGARVGNIENVGRSPEELQAAMTEESKRVVLEALQATNLPGQVGEYLRQLGDINKLTGGDLDKALTRAQTIGTQRAQLEDQLSQLVETSSQRLIRTREAERNATDDLNKALLDQVNTVQDLQDALNKSMTGLQASVEAERAQISTSLNAILTQLDADVKSSMAVVEASVEADRTRINDSLNAILKQLGDNVTQAMNVVEASVDAQRTQAQTSFNATMKALQAQMDSASSTVSRLTDLSSSLHSARDSFTVDPQTGMQHDEASAQIQAAVAIAKAQGKLPDANSLAAPLEVLTRASTDMYASLADFTRARDKDAATIDALAGMSDQGLSTAQQQLQATEDQVQATQDAMDATTARLDGLLETAKEQVAAAEGTTVAVVDTNTALEQLTAATNAYAALFGPTTQQLQAENARLDGILATAKEQVAAATGTTVAIMDSNAALAQLLQATNAYASSFGPTTKLLADENSRLDGVLANAQQQLAVALGTNVAVQGVSTSVDQFNAALLSYLAARDAARASLSAPVPAAAVAVSAPAPAPAPAPQRTQLETFYDNLGQAYFMEVPFAAGAAFTSGVVTRPTAFNIGLMGEQFSEAIMPLANIGGSLGVRALQPQGGELRDLLVEANTMLRAIAQHAFRSAKNTGDLVDRGVTVKTDSDTPLQVQTV